MNSIFLLFHLVMFVVLFRDKVVDFHWNAYDPWTIVSVSDDCDSTGGGGTLQVWKIFLILQLGREIIIVIIFNHVVEKVACESLDHFYVVYFFIHLLSDKLLENYCRISVML